MEKQVNKPTGNLPEKKFSAGAVSATIWRNQAEKEGSVYDYRTISFERRYKDKNGTWQSSSTFRLNDLPKAKLLIEKAYEYLVLNQHESQQESADN